MRTIGETTQRENSVENFEGKCDWFHGSLAFLCLKVTKVSVASHFQA